ncbi:MAG: TRAP transporter large permease subunit [Candidatus Kapabacteria bacterium]|nr:TRAP transporter large permease subunit [Candidatus Kapabacteria bacterium]
MITVATILIIGASIALIARRVDARLVLIIAGTLLASLAGTPTRILDVFQTAVGRGDIIGPICTAMGYAFVLRHTGCDTQMVRLLIRPVRDLSWALVPAGVIIGFITNMAITSQTAAAAAVGPILLPLMLAAGYTPASAGATLLIGCSVGGNLFNPGEPDIVAVKGATGVGIADVIASATAPTLLAAALAIIALILVLSKRGLLPTQSGAARSADVPMTLHDVVRALLAPLPVMLLLVLQPRWNLVPVLQQIWPNGIAVSAIMLVCTALVMIFTAGRSRPLASHVNEITLEFFKGMGHAFTAVISVIIAATCFLAGLESVGAIRAFTGLIASNTDLAAVLSPVITWLLAMVSGSGTAPSVAFSQGVLPALAEGGQLTLAISLGVAGAIGASIGRTMSPVSAVMHFTGSISGASIPDLLRLVWIPMVSALLGTILYGLVFS